MEGHREEAKALLNLRRLLMRELDEFTEEDVCAGRLAVMESVLLEIKKVKKSIPRWS